MCFCDDNDNDDDDDSFSKKNNVSSENKFAIKNHNWKWNWRELTFLILFFNQVNDHTFNDLSMMMDVKEFICDYADYWLRCIDFSRIIMIWQWQQQFLKIFSKRVLILDILFTTTTTKNIKNSFKVDKMIIFLFLISHH